MLLQEELVMKLQVWVISNLFPCAVTVASNTDAEHAIFSCAPRTRIAGAFCSFRDTKVFRIGRPRCDITKKSHFARSIQNRLSVESLHAMKLKQDSLLVFLGNRSGCILLQSLHSFLLFFYVAICLVNDFLHSCTDNVHVAASEPRFC